MRKVLKEKGSIAKAYAFAKQYHDETGAIRKHSGDPYIVHPTGVAEIAIAFGGTDEEVEAALLHDTMEDTKMDYDTLLDEFGVVVADLVSELTNDNEAIRKLGKETYMSNKMINLSDSALFIKLCDIYYNSLDYPKESQLDRMIKNVQDLLEARPKIDERCLDLCEAILDIVGETNKALLAQEIS